MSRIWKDQFSPCPLCKGSGYVRSRRFLKYASLLCPKCLGAKQVVVHTATWKYIPVTVLALAILAFLSWLVVVTTPSNFEGVVPTPIGLGHGLKMASPVAFDSPPPIQEKFLELLQWIAAFLFADSFGRAAIYSPMEIYTEWSRRHALSGGDYPSVEQFVSLWNAGNLAVRQLVERRNQ